MVRVRAAQPTCRDYSKCVAPGEVPVDESEALTAQQARALIEASEKGLQRTFITMALLTGARSGELLALTWAYVDLDTRKVRISRSLSWDRSGKADRKKTKPVFGPPKSDSSYRTLELVPELVTVLQEWKLRSPFKADTDLVFTNSPPLRFLDPWLVGCP